MDPRRIDTLARSVAAPKTRRGFLAAIAATLAGDRAAGQAAAQNGCPTGQTPNRKGDCTCPPGTDACPDGCYNLDRDTANCGGCGQGCVGGTCRKGECRCPSGSTLCGGVCRSCPSGQVCSNGTCQCPPGTQYFDGACVTFRCYWLQDDPPYEWVAWPSYSSEATCRAADGCAEGDACFRWSPVDPDDL